MGPCGLGLRVQGAHLGGSHNRVDPSRAVPVRAEAGDFSMRVALPTAAIGGVLPAPALEEGKTLAEPCAEGSMKGDFSTCAAAVEAAPADPALRRLYAQSLARAADYDGSIRQYREL